MLLIVLARSASMVSTKRGVLYRVGGGGGANNNWGYSNENLTVVVEAHGE